MRYGIVLPYDDVRSAVELARLADDAGWDAYFAWEPLWGIDPWVTLAACAVVTERIRLGTMVTPPSRRRPWKLAGETATLDNLSEGRAILGVGLGALDVGFANFGEETDKRIRAELLDEALDIVTGLWAGQPFNYSGKHYTITENEFPPPPPPVQKPRIPIWVVGAWGRRRSMARALRYDGLIPNVIDDNGTRAPTLEELRAIADSVGDRASRGFDIIMEGSTPAEDSEAAASITSRWAEAGATWWIEGMWEAMGERDWKRRAIGRIEAGPPRS